MKTPLILLALSAALAQPALAAHAVAVAHDLDANDPFVEHRILIDGVDVLADSTQAQARAAAEAARSSVDSWRVWADDFARDMEGSFSYQFSDRVGRGKVVKGAPYSAEAVSESNRTLADGNVISKKSMNRVYRDSQGRTRQETLAADGTVRSVYISDPVAGESYSLVPGSKRAITLPRVSLPGFDVETDGKGHRHIRIGSKEIVTEGGGGGGDGEKRIVIRTHDDADGTSREEVRVQVIRIGDTVSKEVIVTPGSPASPQSPTPPAPPLPPIPPMAMPGMGSLHLDSAIARGKATTAALPAKEIEGVKAEGRSSTTVIAAGEIGNKNPIQVTSESWTSPELQVTLYSRSVDPRFGETLYRLTNIRRGEPSADLFKVPEDYKKSGRAAREARG